MMYGDGYDRDDRGDDSYPYYRPTRSARAASGSGGYPTYPVTADDAAEPEPLGPRARGRSDRKRMPLWQEIPLLLVVVFCLVVLIRTFLVQAFYIPSGSMEDTLRVGDRVLVNKVVYNMRTPERGEIVVFSGTDSWTSEHPADANVGFFSRLGRTVGDLVGISRPGERDFIKRVIGLPGDVVACCDVEGRVTVNSEPLDEPYVTENSPLDAPINENAPDCRSRRFHPVTVEPGHIFVMGDHRLVSRDSRCQGQIPIDHVKGRAWIIVWPSSHWGSLGTPETFAKVPKPAAAGATAGARAAVTPDGMATAVVLPLLWAMPARLRRRRRARQRRLAA